MATTSNYSWTTPDDTDLVKDGASAIRTLGSAIDTTVFNNAGAAVAKSTVDAKGDLIVGTANDTVGRLAVGTDGYTLVADSVEATGLKWVAPSGGGAEVYTNRNPEINNSSFNTVNYNGTDLYVAAGGSGTLASSSDGITWTSRTSGFSSNEINCVVFGNGIWVAVGGNGTLTTSTDGITWTARTSNMGSNQITNVIYANSTFVAVGEGGGATNTGGIISSTDGITWTRKSHTPSVGTTYYGVSWNGTNFQVACSSNGSNNFIYASTAQGTYTAASAANLLGSQSIYGIWNDGTNTIYVAESSASIFSNTGASLDVAGGITYGGATFTANSSANVPRAQNAGIVYDGRFYNSSGIYAYDFDTTPFATNRANRSAPYLIPTAQMTTSGALASNTATAVFAGAIGKIYVGLGNNIYTNF